MKLTAIERAAEISPLETCGHVHVGVNPKDYRLAADCIAFVREIAATGVHEWDAEIWAEQWDALAARIEAASSTVPEGD